MMQKDLQFFLCHAIVKKRMYECEQILLSFFLYLSLLYFSSHQFFYHEFFSFLKKKSHHCEPWFYVFQGYVTENLYSIFRYILYVCE